MVRPAAIALFLALLRTTAGFAPTIGSARLALHRQPARAAPPALIRSGAAAWSDGTPPAARRASLKRLAGGIALSALVPFGSAMAVTTSTFGYVSNFARIGFGFKQSLLKNAGLAVLLSATACVFLGGVLFKLTSSMSLSEGTFKSYSLLNNVPGADAIEDDKGPLQRLVSNVLYMIGVGTFAVLIGIVSDNISSSVEGLRVSNERVLETKHTVVLNWDSHTRPILRQLEAARREGRLAGPVVVLSERDKEEMDAEVADELSRMQPRAGLTVLTRQGSPVELHAIDKTAAAMAKRVIVLPRGAASGADADESAADAEGAAPDTDEALAAELRQSTGLLVELQRGVQSKASRRANVVVAAPPGYHSPQWAQFGSYAEVAPDDFVSRVIAQCAVQPGLSHVYEEILLQGKGNELYTESLSRHSSLHGKTFGEAIRRFPRAIPLGIVRRADGAALGAQDGASEAAPDTTLLSPPDDLVLSATDELILIAGSSRDTRPSRTSWRVKPSSPRRAEVGDTSSLELPSHPAASVQLKPQKLLLIGLDDSMPDIVKQIDEVCPKGSKITLLAPEPPSSPFGLRHCAFKHVKGDPTKTVDLRRVDVSSYDAVVCLQQGETSDADDSRLLVSLLSLQEAAAQEAAAKGDEAEPILPRVVGEVHSPSMLELVASRWPGGVADFVLPTDFAAGILVQFALQPQLKSVYSELLAPMGREILLSAAPLYTDGVEGASITFAELSERARARGEIAIGVSRSGESRPILNPPKDLRLQLGPDDKVVIVGEGF